MYIHPVLRGEPAGRMFRGNSAAKTATEGDFNGKREEDGVFLSELRA
mgnify:CR=1 FL=1